jgi:hypothetical protein
VASEERKREDLERVVGEQAALRRIATIGATEAKLAAAVSDEIVGLFDALQLE